MSAIVACGSEERAREAASERRNDAKFAEYRVPVDLPELEPYAIYPVGGITFDREAERFSFGYGFPRGLAGARQHIDLVGEFAGEMRSFEIRVDISRGLATGEGSCTREGKKFECYETLTGIKVDPELAAARLLEEQKTPQQIDQYLRVTDHFSGDPIGIVSFELNDDVEFAP